MTENSFINFIEENYFLGSTELEIQIINKKPPPVINNSYQSSIFSTSLLGQGLKSKIQGIVLNEKKLSNEIYLRLLSEEKKELSNREKDLLKEMAICQAKLTIFENEFKDQKHKNSELLEKNLSLGKQVHNLFEEREEFLKMKAYFEKKIRRLDESHKNTYDKLDSVKKLMNIDPKKIEIQAYQKAKMATVLFSQQYQVEIIPSNSENKFKNNAKSPSFGQNLLNIAKGPIDNAKNPLNKGKNPLKKGKSPTNNAKSLINNAKSPINNEKTQKNKDKNNINNEKNLINKDKGPLTNAKGSANDGKPPTNTKKTPLKNTKSLSNLKIPQEKEKGDIIKIQPTFTEYNETNENKTSKEKISSFKSKKI